MLRILVPGPLQSDRADRWVRSNADGRAIDRGRDVPAHWPDDARTEIVLAADQVRLIALALPPMPRERLRGAARYALEDQVAAAADDIAIAVTDVHDGRCVAAVASAVLIRAIATDAPRVTRIVPEPALAPRDDGWTWYASGAAGGFVRRADGSAFATGMPAHDDGAPPPELAAALAQALRAHAAPPAVRAAFPVEPSRLADWSRTSGIAFVAAPAWDWEHAAADAWAAAPDFLREAMPAQAGARRPESGFRAWRPAAALAGLALAAYVGGLALEWSWLRVENWRVSRALVSQASAAQLPDAATPAAAAAAIARHDAALRHRARQPAAADPLPLLARASASLAALPPGALRAARYAGDTWTLEFGKLDPSVMSRVMRALHDAGIDALAAPTAAGTRMRLSLAATVR